MTSCWFSHRWSRWTAKTIRALWQPSENMQPIPIEKDMQERTCERCGLTQRRPLSDYA